MSVAQTAEEKEESYRLATIQKLDLIAATLACNLEKMELRFVEMGVRLDCAVATGAPVKRTAKAAAAEKKAPTLMTPAEPATAAEIPAATAAPASEKPPANTMYYFAWCYGTGQADIKKYYTADAEAKALEKVKDSQTYKKAAGEYDKRRIVGLAVWAAGVSTENKLALKHQFKNYQDTATKSAALKQVQPEDETDGEGAED